MKNVTEALERLRELAATAGARPGGDELRGELLELADGLEAGVQSLRRSTWSCAGCGLGCGLEDGIDCPECGRWFCDNCYDTGLGDGCHCHGAGATDEEQLAEAASNIGKAAKDLTNIEDELLNAQQ